MRDRGRQIAHLVLLAAVLGVFAVFAWPYHPPGHVDGEPRPLQILRVLRAAEEEYRCRATPPSYTNIDGSFGPQGVMQNRAWPYERYVVKEGQVETTTGWIFTSIAGTDTYTIVAVPPRTNMVTYSLFETGDIFP